VTGAWEVYLSHALFVLFAGVPYSHPRGDVDLRPHLTNVCIQDGAAPGQVLPFWSMGGARPLAHTSNGYEAKEPVDAACGSFNLQLMENAFELFGVDLLLSHPASGTVPDVTLLEFNASPDVVNSGDALRPNLLEMFEGIVRISVAPFFGRGGAGMALGEDRWGWRKVGEGEVRGGWGA
jgi:hypothetical protein